VPDVLSDARRSGQGVDAGVHQRRQARRLCST
jgi:hypothetical protein